MRFVSASPFLEQVFFQDESKGSVVSAAIAANAVLVSEAVRCVPLPVSEMPSHAVPLGAERCAMGADESEEDLLLLLTRPCLSLNTVSSDRVVLKLFVINALQISTQCLSFVAMEFVVNCFDNE